MSSNKLEAVGPRITMTIGRVTPKGVDVLHQHSYTLPGVAPAPRYSRGIRAANPGHWIDTVWDIRRAAVRAERSGDPDGALDLDSLSNAVQDHLHAGGFQ